MLRPLSSFRRRRSALALAGAAALAAGCGGEPGTAAPTSLAPSPSPGAAASMNMTLLSRLEAATLTTDVHVHHDEPVAPGVASSCAGNWGYSSPDGRAFALTGTSAGLSIVEVSDPGRPRSVALIPGPASSWREVKTFGHYAYVTTEARAGMDIVDLSDPDHPRKVQAWDKTFSSAHTLWIDSERGLLFVNGADGRNGGMRVLDVGADPEDPREIGRFDGFYVHDSYGRGDLLYVSAIYDGFLAVLDTSDPRRIRELNRFDTGGRFTHNSWLTGDGRYLFTTDETPGRPLEGWDLLDLRAPRKVSEYIASPAGMPHNVVVDGDRLLVAHYTDGVHLLDVRDPERPRLLGYYDTYQGPTQGFNGVWGAYIFPRSDLILASDITGGLFVIAYTGR
jgi:choice-of-anchor B domain-containing protein